MKIIHYRLDQDWFTAPLCYAVLALNTCLRSTLIEVEQRDYVLELWNLPAAPPAVACRIE